MNIIRVTPHPVEEDELPLGASKMWGSPDLPHSFDFPTYEDEEGDDVHYVFMCQINCAELARSDKEGSLPHKGMLYIFAKLDYMLGNFLAEPMPSGFWNKGDVKVLFWPHDDTDALEEVVLLDDDDEEVAMPPCRIGFSPEEESPLSPATGYKISGLPAGPADGLDMDKYRLLFQFDRREEGNLLYFLIPKEDLGHTFKNVTAYLASI